MTKGKAGSERREQILSAAMDMFGEVGYRGTSLRDIATRVGITHPGLLYHFNSKEELLQAVLARRDEMDADRFHLWETDDPLVQLQGLIGIIASNIKVPGLIELYATLSAEATNPQHPAHEYFKGRYVVLVSAMEQAVHGLNARGLLRDSELNAREIAEKLVALIEGLQLQWLYDRELDIVGLIASFVNERLVSPITQDDWESVVAS